MNVLGIFVKQPIPGTVKTRLAVGIGEAAAANLYSAFVHDILSQHSRTADCQTLWFAGADMNAAEEWASTVAGGNFEVQPQPEGDLGTRIKTFFEFAFDAAREPDEQPSENRAILIGSDSPSLPTDYVQQAFKALEQDDIVLGPSNDGGYYLVGMRRKVWEIFDQINWSSAQVFQQTIRAVQDTNASFSLLPVWYDVDTVDDARFLWAHEQAFRSASMQFQPKTYDALCELFRDETTN